VARKPSTIFVSPDMKGEDLLAHACESLASASVMLAELAVNRMLDNIKVSRSSPHR
jgi:hypothetical protein